MTKIMMTLSKFLMLMNLPLRWKPIWKPRYAVSYINSRRDLSWLMADNNEK